MLISGLSSKRTSDKIIMGIFAGLFIAIPSLAVMGPVLTQNIIYLIMYIIGTISIAILLVFVQIMPKRTKYGNEMLGKLRGFKRFLETAEKEQLEALVNQNPEYFYNILPYTYALGVSDVWMSRFETIAMKSPDWYVGYSAFNFNDFNHFMSDTMKSAQTAMSSSPSSSSGGGSSGGGSGGGGGGSW